MGARNVPRTGDSSFHDHTNDRFVVLEHDEPDCNWALWNVRMEHGQSYPLTFRCQNESVDDSPYFDAQGFPQHLNVKMCPKQNPTIVMLVYRSILKPS